MSSSSTDESIRTASDWCSTKDGAEDADVAMTSQQRVTWRRMVPVVVSTIDQLATRRDVATVAMSQYDASFWKRPSESRIQRHRLSILLPPAGRPLDR